MSSVKIILIHDSKYGLETHVMTLANSLKRLGLNVTVICLPPIESEKVTIATIFKFLKHLMLSSYLSAKLIRTTKRDRITIVHVHSPRIPLLMGYFLHVVKRIPLVFTVHERFSFSLLLNRLYTKATKVIAISPELKKKIQTYGVHEDKLIVIPNMVDTDVFSPIVADPNSIVSSPAHSFKLLSAGRLDLSKELLIITVMELMPRIVSVIPKTQLLVIGGGPRIEHLKDIASKINHQVGKDIIFVLGRVHNLVKFLREADMVIGVGRVAIEAMSCGKPVIVASNNGGFVFSGALVTKENALELSKSNFSGRGYCEKMDPERFYKVILELLVNEKYRKRVGIEGRAFVKKNLDALVITKRTLSVYLECLNVR